VRYRRRNRAGEFVRPREYRTTASRYNVHMNPRVFLDVDPRMLRVPPSRLSGADPFKLHRQIAQFGDSDQGMPTIEVSRGADAELVINNGVTRATRIAKLSPGKTVRVEVIDDLPIPVGVFPSIGDLIP
jgi:hypothetical protein